MKAILKNKDKYFDIKLAKGIFLNDESAVNREGGKGISSTTYGSVWFILPKGKALFKTYDDIFFPDIRKNRIVNELVCNQLCKQLNIACPEMLPAHLGTYTGLASYNILKDNEQIIDGIGLGKLTKTRHFDNVFEDYATMINKLSRMGYKIDKSKTIIDIYKMCILDILTLQTDRHEENIMFIINNKTKELKLAPLLDNEFAFMAKRLTNVVYSSNEYLEEHIERLYILARNEFLIKTKKEDTASVERIVRQFTNLAKQNPNFEIELKHIICNIDIKDAIKKVKGMGYNISKEYCEFMEFVVNYVRNLFISQYKNEKEVDKKPKEEQFER